MTHAAHKAAAIRPDVRLQPHQENLRDLASRGPLRMLLLHGLGSGKSLSGLAAAEQLGQPYTAVAPASLRQNYRGEIKKFTDRSTPADVMSYSEIAQGRPVPNASSLIFDEAQALRNPNTAQAARAADLAAQAKQVVLLSGTPVVNRPGDLATPLRLLTGENLSPEAFEARYVKEKNVYPNLLRRLVGWPSGKELAIHNERELRGKLKGHVHYYDRGAPVVPVSQEDIHVPMSAEQARIHDIIWDKLPWWVRARLQNNALLSDEELRRTAAFLSGPRQVGLSTLPFLRNKDPLRAFNQSPKLQAANKNLLERLKDPRSKALVFANYIDAGLSPYSAGLSAAGIPHAVFHGGLNDRLRKQLVDDYNAGRIRVALLGPSGTEGLSFKGTQLVQLLDPHWNPVRPKQSIGRALRYDSHADLPDELKHVHVQRYFSRLPQGWRGRLLGAVGLGDESKTYAADDHLAQIADRKEKLNRKFLDLLRSVGSTRQP